jgi:hypothetical protein
MPKKAQFTHERVEYNETSPLKDRLKSLSLRQVMTFISVHTGENSQIVTVSNKKIYLK